MKKRKTALPVLYPEWRRAMFRGDFMLKIPDDDLLQSTSAFLKAYDNASSSGFTEDMYLSKVIPREVKKANHTYPYQVKIPKSNVEMLRDDFEPSRIITITKPFEGPYGEMWFGNTSKGFQLFAGYKNGDSRFGCDVALGDGTVHGILVGATGQGKSVTLNAYIYGGCYVYPPWELSLTLCDAKIVEFKGIAVNNPMPQIASVAATGDADYLISVLADKDDEMHQRNNIFIEAEKVFGRPVKKIEDFREITGLALPQIIIIIDEFQVMLKGAGKKLPELMKHIYNFAKLGRNTGIHLLLASQEVGTDLPKEVLSNISLRMAMGCFPSVSDAVLGNDGAAANMGKKGYMILNSNTAEKNSKQFNVLYRVPFAPPSQIKEMSTNIIRVGKEMHVGNVMKFYDEQTSVTESEYVDFLKQFHVDLNTFYLGEPAFVLDDKEQCLKFRMTGKEVENISVVTNTDKGLARFAKMLQMNIQVAGGCSNLVLCTHPTINDIVGFSGWSGKFYYEDKQYEGSLFFAITKSLIYKRKLMLLADANIFKGLSQQSDISDRMFDETVGRGSEYDTKLNRERFAQYYGILCEDAMLQAGLGLEGMKPEDAMKQKKQLAYTCIMLCSDYGASNVQLVLKKIPVLYFWIVGADRVIGLGRSSKSRCVEDLLKCMQDSCEVNCRYIMLTSTYTDITLLLGGMKWFILDNLSASEITKIKCGDQYPSEVSGRLAVLRDFTDTSLNSCKKFKKMLFDGEIIM